MRSSSLLLSSLARLALAPVAAHAQRADSAVVGRWSGRADLTSTVTRRRGLDVQLDVRDDGTVVGTIGDATLAHARIYRDSRFAQSIRLARKFALEGTLVGAVVRDEGVVRDRVHLSLDRVGSTLTGELHTSGQYTGPASGRILTARVTLQWNGPALARERDPRVELAGAPRAAPSPKP
jgi:hypothetical protein